MGTDALEFTWKRKDLLFDYNFDEVSLKNDVVTLIKLVESVFK